MNACAIAAQLVSTNMVDAGRKLYNASWCVPALMASYSNFITMCALFVLHFRGAPLRFSWGVLPLISMPRSIHINATPFDSPWIVRSFGHFAGLPQLVKSLGFGSGNKYMFSPSTKSVLSQSRGRPVASSGGHALRGIRHRAGGSFSPSWSELVREDENP